MGYSTDFHGHFEVTPPLSAAQVKYLNKFGETRRMDRDASVTAGREDPVREAVGLPVGRGGQYFVGENGFAGQGEGADVVNYNRPPTGQPGLWCQWEANPDGSQIQWNGGEKFYNYTEWLEYIVEHFLKPWGCQIDGEISWDGESPDDSGVIYAKGNRIEAVFARVHQPGPSW